MTTCVSSKQSNATGKKKLRQYSGVTAVASCVKIELHPLQEALALQLGREEEPHEALVVHRLSLLEEGQSWHGCSVSGMLQRTGSRSPR